MGFTRTLDLVIEIIGAAVGVILGLMADRWLERRRFSNRINQIASIIREEMSRNYKLIKTWNTFKARFWEDRAIYQNEYLETYKVDLYRWSTENQGHFPQIMSAINELNSFILRYGDNPRFQGTIETLTYNLRKLLVNQPAPFDSIIENDDS